MWPYTSNKPRVKKTKLQSWEINGEVVRIKPDVVDGKVMPWAEYSPRELSEMLWVLRQLKEPLEPTNDVPDTNAPPAP